MSPLIQNQHATQLRARLHGLSLIELMIAIAMGMVVVGALLALYLNVTRTNNEMAKMNRQIENGRFAIQLLQDDVVHAGFWGAYTPQFDDLTIVTAPLDAPNAVPDPCLAYADWTDAHRNNLIGIPLQGYQAPPGGCGLANQQANTDVLVVRHAQPCVAGAAGCDPDVGGNVYFQSSLCEKEVASVAQQPNDATTIKLAADASGEDNYYTGATIRIVSGVGAGQTARITGYVGSTKVATIDPAWTTVPDNSSVYSFGLGYVLDVAGHILHKRDCTTLADKRKLISNIYYVRSFSTPGDGIPTLMRASFDGVAHLNPQPLIEGIEAFRVLYGIDRVSDAGTAVNYATAVAWADPMNRVSPLNRGDGIPDEYVDASALSCNSASDCNLANVVSVQIHVLARSLEPTLGHVDTKSYRLGDLDIAAAGDGFKRHVFSTTVRLVNPAGRRDTP